MNTLQFKTNIKCVGCEAKVTPALNGLVGEHGWKVDTQNPDKLLTITSGASSEAQVIAALKKAGFEAASVA